MTLLCWINCDNDQWHFYEVNPQVALPATGSIYVRGRVCKNTKGKFRHNCEDNLCKSCSFTNYFVTDPSVTKQKAKKEGAVIQFSDEFDVNFVLDSVVSWSVHEKVGEDLPGERKYDHLIYTKVRGTVQDFLLVFQRACSKWKPHKCYQHQQDKRKEFSLHFDNQVLRPNVVAIYADYSKNPKKMSGRSSLTQQYRDMPDFSLLNLNIFYRRFCAPTCWLPLYKRRS